MERPGTSICLLILIASALLLCGSAASQEPRGEQHERASAEESKRAQAYEQEPTVPLSVLNATKAALIETLHTIRAQEEIAAQQNRSHKDNWDKAAVLANYLLFLVGVCYTLFAWGQWAAIKTQAAIANKSVDSLMHAERPHITLGDFERYDFLGLLDDQEKLPYIIYDFKNLGRTPAFMVEYAIRLRMIEGEIPEVPDYGEPFKFPDGYIIGRDEHSFKERRNLEDGILTKENIKAVRVGAAHLVFYGHVTYRNVFSFRSNSKPHEHRFCLVWKPENSLFIFGGPTAYNHYS